MKENFDANKMKSLRVKDFIDDKDKLWNYCLYWAMHKGNFNFAEVSLKSIRQKDIYNVDKLDYGLCGLTAMYSSFNEFLQLSMEDISNIVEKSNGFSHSCSSRLFYTESPYHVFLNFFLNNPL